MKYRSTEKADNINDLYSKLGEHLDGETITRMIDYIDEGKDEDFIKIRLDYFGIKDIDTVYNLLVQLNELYD